MWATFLIFNFHVSARGWVTRNRLPRRMTAEIASMHFLLSSLITTNSRQPQKHFWESSGAKAEGDGPPSYFHRASTISAALSAAQDLQTQDIYFEVASIRTGCQLILPASHCCFASPCCLCCSHRIQSWNLSQRTDCFFSYSGWNIDCFLGLAHFV